MKPFANFIGYTDIRPFEIISHTIKTISIREMDTVLDSTWKPEFKTGGFSAVCVNQNSQRWDIITNENNPIIKAYLRKDGYYWSKLGRHLLADNPVKNYDYNF